MISIALLIAGLGLLYVQAAPFPSLLGVTVAVVLGAICGWLLFLRKAAHTYPQSVRGRLTHYASQPWSAEASGGVLIASLVGAAWLFVGRVFSLPPLVEVASLGFCVAIVAGMAVLARGAERDLQREVDAGGYKGELRATLPQQWRDYRPYQKVLYGTAVVVAALFFLMIVVGLELEFAGIHPPRSPQRVDSQVSP